MDTFIRNDIQISILHKVRSHKEHSFSEILNAGRFFGFHTKIEWEAGKKRGRIQTADGKDFINVSAYKTEQHQVKVYIHGGECWVSRAAIPKNIDAVDKNKVIIPRSGNPGNIILGKPKLSEAGSCSSNTYIVALPIESPLTLQEADNMLAYIKTKFFRFLVAIKTSTQDVPPKAYEFVPIQDFSKPWVDEELYIKYNLSEEEIGFIESTIKPIES